VWEAARARALDDDAIDEDAPVYDYVVGRGLSEAWEMRLFGILGDGMDLPDGVQRWARDGYRVVVPLFDQAGEIACVQSRSILPDAQIKTRFPKGSHSRGTMFASERGLEVIRGDGPAGDPVIIGEGLTDFLALATATAIPVVSAPGAGGVRSVLGPWLRGRRVILALDGDAAGLLAAVSVADVLAIEFDAEPYRLTWPEGCKDACDVVERECISGLSEILEALVWRVEGGGACA
jgi:hypothetical protein